MNKVSTIGDFSIFGFTQQPGVFLQTRIQDRLGVTPRLINIGDSGRFFLHTTYGDVAESNESVVLKLGFLRSPELSPLSAKQLLDLNIVRPNSIDSGRLRGNALVVCLGKKEISFSAYKTLLAVPQLYYAQIDGGFIGSDRLKCLVQVLDRVDLNEDVIPLHFLFRSTPGDLTYYRQISRMLPGEFLLYQDNKFSRKIVQDFHITNHPSLDDHGKVTIADKVYNSLQSVTEDYIAGVERMGEHLGNLLSGGVDSSLLQHLINTKTADRPPRSYSFAVRVPSFAHEIEYARQASLLFKTEHTFVEIQPTDFPGLLSRTIDALAQPPILETEPGMLSIAEFAKKEALKARHFFSGQGADAIFGMHWSRKLKGLHLASQVPGAERTLKATSNLLKPFSRLSQMMKKGGEIIACSNDPDAFLSPANSVVVFTDFEFLRQCFGEDTLKNALRYRREFSAKYLDTEHFLEKVHIVDLVTETYEVVIQRHQLFLAQEREQIHPFFDDQLLRTAFSIPENKRYIKGLQPKYLLKEILHKKAGAAASYKRKGFSIWEADLMSWMTSGPLLPMVREIKLPGFLSKTDFDNLLRAPNYFLWELLIFDLFQKNLQSTLRKQEQKGYLL